MNPVETEVRAAGASSRWSGETPDEAVLERVRAGETALSEVLVRRHNRLTTWCCHGRGRPRSHCASEV
jgi:hypothetical protein